MKEPYCYIIINIIIILFIYSLVYLALVCQMKTKQNKQQKKKKDDLLSASSFTRSEYTFGLPASISPFFL